MSKSKKQRRESSDSEQEESSSSSSDSSSSSSSSSSDSSNDKKRKKPTKGKVRAAKSSSGSSGNSSSSSDSDSNAEEQKRRKKVTKKCKQAKKPQEEKHLDNTTASQKSRPRRKEDRIDSSVTNRSKWDSPNNEHNDDQRDKNRDRRYEEHSRNERSRQWDRRDNDNNRRENDNRNSNRYSDNRYRDRPARNWDRDRDRHRRSPDHRQEPRDNNRRHFNERRENNDRRRSRSPRRGRNFPRRTEDDGKTYEWGKRDADKDRGDQPPVEKEKPDFGLSGKLTEDTNKVNGIVIKYAEPLEARKPKRRWRLYPFKGEKALATLYIHRQSCYLIGRDRKVCDLPVDHPSCSKQHAALQYRLVPFEREDGTAGKRVRPYIIDLDSANGTFINNKQIEAKKYIELLEKDVIKFGFSSREYVLLHENSKEDQLDDDIQEEVPVKEEPAE